MAPLPINDILIGIGALAIAAVAIYMFIRASGGELPLKRIKPKEKTSEEPPAQPVQPIETVNRPSLSQVERHLRQTDVERARSSLRTLTLKRELLTMVLKRLFEAEDEEEITREERLRLSRDYEAEMKKLGEDLKQAELVVTLNELETIREDILKKYESTLNETQARIDAVLKELKLEKPKKVPAKEPPKRKRVEKKEEEPEEEEEEERPPAPRRRRSEVEEKLEQLRKEVLKELEELEKLEIEA